MIDRELHDKLKRICDLLFECHEQLLRGGLSDDSRIIRAAYSAVAPVRDRVGYLLNDQSTTFFVGGKKVVKDTNLEPSEDNER